MSGCVRVHSDHSATCTDAKFCTYRFDEVGLCKNDTVLIHLQSSPLAEMDDLCWLLSGCSLLISHMALTA